MTLSQKNFEEIITFTRASDGGRYNSEGIYEILPPNQQRIDYDPVTKLAKGLLIEESRTRLNSYATDFSSTVGTELTVTATGNTVKGFAETKLVPSTVGTIHSLAIYSHPTNSVVSRNSVIVKAGEYRYLTLTRKNSFVVANDSFARFDLQTGTVQVDYTASALIEPLGDGVYRCSLQGVNTNTINCFLAVAVESSISPTGYASTAGDGVSGLYLYHAQCEDGAFGTSPILGEGTQVTRAADVASVNVLSPWHNASEGTLFVDSATFATPLAGKAPAPLNMIGPAGERIAMTKYNAGPGSYYAIFGGGVDSGTFRQASVASSKDAIAYKVGEIARLVVNGSTATPSSGAALPYPVLVTSMQVGGVATGALNGHIRAIKHYPRRLTDAELQTLTA